LEENPGLRRQTAAAAGWRDLAAVIRRAERVRGAVGIVAVDVAVLVVVHLIAA
jgi:hypothetical protein